MSSESIPRSPATPEAGRPLLRHTLAILAYRGGKAVRDAPSAERPGRLVKLSTGGRLLRAEAPGRDVRLEVVLPADRRPRHPAQQGDLADVGQGIRERSLEELLRGEAQRLRRCQPLVQGGQTLVKAGDLLRPGPGRRLGRVDPLAGAPSSRRSTPPRRSSTPRSSGSRTADSGRVARDRPRYRSGSPVPERGETRSRAASAGSPPHRASTPGLRFRRNRAP